MSDRDKKINRIRQLLAQAESELKIGNEGAASLFSEKAQELIEKYNVQKSEIEAAIIATEQNFVNELNKTIIGNPFTRVNAKQNHRTLWFEQLAKVIGSAYNCRVDIGELGAVIFYGYDSDRELAIFMFQKLAEIANIKATELRLEHKRNVGKPPKKILFSKEVITFPSKWMGDEVFTDSIMKGIRGGISEIYAKYEKDENKISAVDVYFRNEIAAKNNERSQRYYINYEPEPISHAINDEVIELGKKIGHNIIKTISKNPSSAIQIATGKTRKMDESSGIVYLVIDCSKSMDGSKIRQAREGAKNYIKKAQEKGYAVGLIKFHSTVHHLISPRKEFDETFERKIEGLEAEGYTNMRDAIIMAHVRFIDRKIKRTICIVTDGMPQNIEGTLSAAADAKRDGIEIMAIGTDDARQEFLDKLCSREGLGLLVNNQKLQLGMGEMANRL